MKLRRSLLLTLLPSLALTACADDGVDDGRGGDPVSATDVAVVDNDFEPGAITVDVGDTVTWTWDGSNPHDVVGDDFASEIQTSGTFAHTFATVGEFDYVCRVHSGMRGRVVVQ